MAGRVVVDKIRIRHLQQCAAGQTDCASAAGSVAGFVLRKCAVLNEKLIILLHIDRRTTASCVVIHKFAV